MNTRQHSTTLDNTRQHSTTLDNTRLTSISKTALFKIYVFLTMSILMLNSNKIIAQNDSIPTYSYFGVFDKVLNRFGELKSWDDLLIEAEGSNPVLTLNKGVFKLNFYQGCGLENISSAEHNQRRQVFLELFEFANQAFGNTTSTDSIFVRFLPMTTSNTLYGNEPIAATSYYIVPDFSEGFSEITDCVVSQIINGGKNPFSELGSYPTRQNILNNLLAFSHLDFHLNLEAFNTNTNLSHNTIAPNQIDLYSAALREFLVSLGLNSMLQANGTSLSPNQSQYSRLDEQLRIGSENFLIYNQTTKKYALNANLNFNSIFNFSSSSCDSLLSCGLSPSISNSNIKLSISACFRVGYEYTFLNPGCDTSLSVLDRNWLYGSVRRVPSSKDIMLLESIGYKINGCFGLSEFSTSFCNNTLPELLIKPTGLLGLTEFGSYQFVVKDSFYSIAYESFIDDFIRLESLEILDFRGANNTISSGANALTISFVNPGQQILRIRTKHDDFHFSTSYLILRLRGGGGGGCFENCNLIGNGSFENISSLITCGIIFPFGEEVDLDCWGTYGSTSPDLFTINCPDPRCDFEGNGPAEYETPIPLNTAPPSSSILHLYSRRVDTIDNINIYEEAAQSELAETLIVGNTYEMSLRVLRRTGIGIPVLRIFLRNGEFAATGNDFEVNAADPALFHIFNDEIEEEFWQTITFQFVCTVPNLNFIVVHNEGTGPAANTSAETHRALLIDNLRLSTIPNATFNIPQEFSCGTLISSLPSFGSPAGGTVSGPGVIGTAFSPVLAGPGTHVLTYNVTTPNGCDLTAYDHIVVHPSIHFNNAVISPTCSQACSGSITLNPTLNTTEPTLVTYLWTGPSINANNQNSINLTNLCAGTYTVTATIEGECIFSQTFIVTSSPVPSVSFSIDYDFCNSSCNASITVNSSIPNSSIIWSGGLSGFNPTNVCAGNYLATVTSPNGCNSSVFIPVSNATLQTLNVTNTATWNEDNVEYDNITLSPNSFLTILTSTDVIINGTITVNNGARLFITQSTLRFGPNGRIIVNPGGRLALEQTILTNNCANQYWRGIEVRGSTGHSQADIAMSANITQPATENDGLTNQGGVFIYKNSRIEYALIGVKLYAGVVNLNGFSNTSNSGGFIKAEESTFLNNRNDVIFSTYGTLNYSNLSKFDRCRFEVNSNHITSNIMGERIVIRQTSKVTFIGCTWINSSMAIANNTNSQTVDDQAALRLSNGHCSIDSHITGQNITPCSFLGFVYGIRASGTYLNSPLSINEAQYRCYRGIYASGLASGSKITACTFQGLNATPSPISIAIPTLFINDPSTTPWVNNSITNNGNPADFTTMWSKGPAYGVYLNSPGSMIIIDNDFQITGALTNQRVGLYVNGGGANLLNITSNRFRGNSFGIRFFNSNRSSSDATINGTSFQCNEFVNNDLHVEINAHLITSTNSGINENIWNVALNRSYSNIFDSYQSPITSLPAGRNIWDNVIPYHLYRGRFDEVNGNTTRIAGIGGTSSIFAQYSAFFPWNPECGATNMGMGVNELLADFELKKTALENYKDDGDPEYYQYLVESMNSSNIVQRFNELSGASPSLSVDRIIEILDKESELPRSMLLNILMSNISSLKNGESLSKLDSLQTPLTSWEKDSLFTLFSNIDAKGVLESQVNEAAFKVHNAISEELMSILLDSLVINKTPAIEDFNSKLNILTSGDNELINAQNDFNYILIISIIENKLFNIRESSMESKDLIKLKELVEETTSYGSTDSIIHLNYDGFASNYIIPELPMTYRMADLIINKFDSSGYHGDLEYPFGIPSTRSAFKPNLKEIRYEIKAFPNPANTYLQIQSQVEDISNSVIIVRDLAGREIPVEALTKSKNEWVIDVNQWASGSYIIELRKEGKIIYTNNLLIQR